MQRELPSLKEHYCHGCSTCVNHTITNFYEYLWLYPVAYCVPQSEASLHNRECDICNVFCTILCLPTKCCILLPNCPCCTFCPQIYDWCFGSCKCRCCKCGCCSKKTDPEEG